MSYDAPPPSYGGSYSSGGAGPHPKATTILVLGILGLVCCAVLAPVAWIMGNGAMKEVQAGQYQEDTALKVGRILGIVGTVLWILGTILWVVVLGGSVASLRASS